MMSVVFELTTSHHQKSNENNSKGKQRQRINYYTPLQKEKPPHPL